MVLKDRIEGFADIEKEFSSWEATEIIIDDKKAFWELKKPDTEYRKVCLYRDGCNMLIYGDYGSIVFDSMTWLGSVYNLQYDNIGYQMEKLTHECRKSIYKHDTKKAWEDILDWLADRLSDCYEELFFDDEGEDKQFTINDVLQFFRNTSFINCIKIENFCIENNCKQLQEIMEFTDSCLGHSGEDELEWLSFLRGSLKHEIFEDPCESSLWSVGQKIDQGYFINLYALQVCAEKLKHETSKEKRYES